MPADMIRTWPYSWELPSAEFYEEGSKGTVKFIFNHLKRDLLL
jgi:hypothetical protein